MAISQIEDLYLSAAAVCAVGGAVFDVCTRRIPNLLTGPAALIGLAVHFVCGGWAGLWSSLASGLVCGLAFLFFFLAGGMGAGDVKLMAAVGILAGMPRAVPLLILTAISGGALALGLALLRGRLCQTLSNMGALLEHHRLHGFQPHPGLNLANPQTLRLPYGMAIAAGTILTFFLALGQG